MNPTRRAKRGAAAIVAGFVMVVAFLAMTVSPASAQAADCQISDFRNPDGSLDITSYLMCNGMGNLPAPGPECPTAELSLATALENPNIAPGETVSLTLQGFAPGSTITVTICGNGISRELGTFTAGSDGSVNVTVTIPTDLPPGDYFLAIKGPRSSGAGQIIYAPISVGTSGGGGTPQGGNLPRTGSDLGQMVGLALVLTFLGGAVALGSRRLNPPAEVNS